MTLDQLVLCLLLAQAAPQTPAPEGTALITGRVVDGVTKSPVSAAVVSLSPPGASRRAALDNVITDSNGRYFFDRIKAGTYAISVTKPGYLDGGFGQLRPEGASVSLEIKDRERRSNIQLGLWKRAVLSGTVLDEANDPIVDVLVWAVRKRIVSGRPQMELLTAVRTDDRGAFRLSNLPPGEYSLFLPAMISSGPITFGGGSAPIEWYQTMTGVGVAPLSVDRDTAIAAGDGRNLLNGMTELVPAPEGDAPWMTLPSTFLGSDSTPTFIKLAPGQDRQDLSILARRVATQKIAGTLYVNGGSAASHVLHLLPAAMADFPLFDLATATTDASGAFVFYGIPAGSYVVRVVKMPVPKGPNLRATTGYVDQNRKFVSMSSGEGRGASAPPVDTEPLQFANESVVVGETPVRGLSLTLRPGVRISGRAVFDGTAAQPAPNVLATVRVVPEAANGFSGYQTYLGGRFAEDATFTTPSLLPGSYVLRPSAPPGWAVKSVSVGGLDVTEQPLEVGADVIDVVVTFTDRAGRISGTVVRSAGDADDGAQVVMFPANASTWTGYGINSRRLASTRAAASGAFSLAAPPPGDYFFAAIPEEQSADWRDPAILAKLAATAQRVAVRDDESPKLSLIVRSIR